jgi:hypothetical protein
VLVAVAVAPSLEAALIGGGSQEGELLVCHDTVEGGFHQLLDLAGELVVKTVL